MADNQNDINVRFGAETKGVEDGSNRAAKSVETASDRMRQSLQNVGDSAKNSTGKAGESFKQLEDGVSGSASRIGTALGGMAKAVGSIAAVFGAVAIASLVLKKTADGSQKAAEEAVKLGNTLGITATRASALAAALEDAHADTQSYVGAFQAISRQIRTNEGDLNSLGVKTRDTNGQFRDSESVMMDALGALREYKGGLDQQQAAQAMFGRGAHDAIALLRLQSGAIDEQLEKQRRLNTVIGQENVEAAEAYYQSMNDVGDVLDAMKRVIGDAVMPILTELGDWFSSIGPAAVTVIKGAIGGLAATFWYLRNGVLTVWQVFLAFAKSIAAPIEAIGKAFWAILHGDMKGAQDALTDWPTNIANAWDQAMNHIADTGRETNEKVMNLFANRTEADAPGGKKSFKGRPEEKKGAEKSRMGEYEDGLSQVRLAYAQQQQEAGTFHAFSKQQEAEYWTDMLRRTDVSLRDRLAIVRKLHESELAEQVKLNEQLKAAQAVGEQMIRDAKLAAIDEEEAGAKHMVDLRKATNDQVLRQELDFEARRQEIRLAGIDQQIQDAINDPDRDLSKIAQLHSQRQQLELTHQQRMREIRRGIETEAAKESFKVWDDLSNKISGLWDKGVTALMNGTLTWRNAMKAVGAELVAWFANDVVKKKVAAWVNGEQMQTLASKAATAIRQFLFGTEAATTVATKTGEATAVISANAAEAASGAAASQAAIPVVGPALALAAFATVMATVLGAKSLLSARNGFDIPAGLNPVTQLHEREMVLPAAQADAVRDMASGGGRAPVQLKGVSAGEFFIAARKDLIAVLKGAHRDFAL